MIGWYKTLRELEVYTNSKGKSRKIILICRNPHTFEITITYSDEKGFKPCKTCSERAFQLWLRK